MEMKCFANAIYTTGCFGVGLVVMKAIIKANILILVSVL